MADPTSEPTSSSRDAEHGESDGTGLRLEAQLRFVLELDRLKGILRRTLLIHETRRENSAEHSWHLAMMALVLHEHSPEPVDLRRVLEMLLVHDIVEIDAGDTYAYDEAGNRDKAEREERAARRIFGLLPSAQADLFRERWMEFEARETPEARFANALDRLQPMLLNYHTQGRAWAEHGVRRSQVVKRNSVIDDGAPELWSHALELIEEAVERGWISNE